jgi:hypothetical protein
MLKISLTPSEIEDEPETEANVLTDDDRDAGLEHLAG